MNIQDIQNISTSCTRTEFVGTAVLDTIGLVISGIDDTLLKEYLKHDKELRNTGNITVWDFSAPVQVLPVRSQLLMTQSKPPTRRSFPLSFQGIPRDGAVTATTLYLEEMTFPMCVMPFPWH